MAARVSGGQKVMQDWLSRVNQAACSGGVRQRVRL
jgi:hypothetical protein